MDATVLLSRSGDTRTAIPSTVLIAPSNTPSSVARGLAVPGVEAMLDLRSLAGGDGVLF